MNTLRALLWKEGRAAACRVAACACLALLAGVAHIDWVSPLLPFRLCHETVDSLRLADAGWIV